MGKPGASKKSKFAVGGGIILTAVVGFIFGMGSNQVTDWVKRADDCIDGLTQYALKVESDITDKADGELLEAQGQMTNSAEQGPQAGHASPTPPPPEQLTPALLKFNADIVMPRTTVTNRCPMKGSSTEYLDAFHVSIWKDDFTNLRNYCFQTNQMSDAKASAFLLALDKSTHTLIDDADAVPNWGLVGRTKYEITHLL